VSALPSACTIAGFPTQPEKLVDTERVSNELTRSLAQEVHSSESNLTPAAHQPTPDSHLTGTHDNVTDPVAEPKVTRLLEISSIPIALVLYLTAVGRDGKGTLHRQGNFRAEQDFPSLQGPAARLRKLRPVGKIPQRSSGTGADNRRLRHGSAAEGLSDNFTGMLAAVVSLDLFCTALQDASVRDARCSSSTTTVTIVAS